MDWWWWLAGGVALVAVEVAAPTGFFVMFFGVGAMVVGALAAAGIVTTLSLQVLAFTVLSVFSLLLFRGRLQRIAQAPPASNVDSLVGVLAIVQERLSPGVVGRVEVRGAMWSARNTSGVTLDPGQRARVSAVDGLTLAVVPE
jgi:membrane protein implicated in regulation of membrane protease activity